MQNTVAFYFTDDAIGTNPLEIIPRLPSNAGVVFRHYNITNRENLAIKVEKLCKKHKIRLIIASDPKLAHSVRASGCHLPEHQISQAPFLKQKFPNLFLTAACHSERAIRLAIKYECDAAFLSPVFTTASHPGAPPLRFHPSALTAQRAAIPVFALGGMNKRRWRQASLVGFSGFGAIRSLEVGNFSNSDVNHLR